MDIHLYDGKKTLCGCQLTVDVPFTNVLTVSSCSACRIMFDDLSDKGLINVKPASKIVIPQGAIEEEHLFNIVTLIRYLEGEQLSVFTVEETKEVSMNTGLAQIEVCRLLKIAGFLPAPRTEEKEEVKVNMGGCFGWHGLRR